MTTRIKISLIWLWMAALFTSTVGISVQQLYCFCVGETTFSLFDEAIDACAGEKAVSADACCKVAPPPCCAAEDTVATDEHGCTKKSVRVLRLNVEYLIGQPLDKTLTYPVTALIAPVWQYTFQPPWRCSPTLTNKAPPPLPPCLSGRMISLRHEVFRC
ncbi:MAG: hypothetical protein EP344_15655 [Bacteroidetes bacterium]|nr:MAG: hypothetical protein EP344_15655 [Bacteroidota bacterium]